MKFVNKIYKKNYWVIATLLRIVLFPVMLVVRIYKWTYGYFDD